MDERDIELDIAREILKAAGLDGARGDALRRQHQVQHFTAQARHYALQPIAQPKDDE
jgi:hypothetical protein